MNENDIRQLSSRLTFWILGDDGRTPEEVAWERFLEWTVKIDGVSVPVSQEEAGGCHVSTVFIARMVSAHDPLPLWHFETLVSRDDGSATVADRYATWDEAETGHASSMQAATGHAARKLS